MDGALIDSQRLAEDAAVHSVLVQWEGHENLKRVKAFHALQGERKYQEQFNPNVLFVGEELCLLQCYINKAMVEYANTLNVPSEPATMEVIRKIGAMCLRAMEHHGSIKREEAKEEPIEPPKTIDDVLIEQLGGEDNSEPVEPTPPPIEEYDEGDVSPDSQECSGEDCGCHQ